MDGHASPAELPELQEFLACFQVRFRRPEGRAALERYTTGLLTELPNKNCDTIAQAVPGTSEQRLQEFLTKMQWDEEDLNRQRVQKMIAEATRGEGVLVFDDTGFPKQGKGSVGVERQYSGTLGKVGNCQIAVTCCYTDSQATWPVAVRLYLPKTWADTPMRLQILPQAAQGEVIRPEEDLPGKTYGLLSCRGNACRISTTGVGRATICGLPLLVRGIRQMACCRSTSDHCIDRTSCSRAPVSSMVKNAARTYTLSCCSASRNLGNSSGCKNLSLFVSGNRSIFVAGFSWFQRPHAFASLNKVRISASTLLAS
jgi:DDE superfamily endonuclease